MQSISTEAGVGGTVLYLERGERHTITMYRGVGGGYNNKCYWLMELLLYHANFFNWFFHWFFYTKIFALGCSISSFFFRHANAKLPPKHWTLIVIQSITSTILYCWVLRVAFEYTCALSVASHFPLCVQFLITEFFYLTFVIDPIRRVHGISGP